MSKRKRSPPAGQSPGSNDSYEVSQLKAELEAAEKKSAEDAAGAARLKAEKEAAEAKAAEEAAASGRLCELCSRVRAVSGRMGACDLRALGRAEALPATLTTCTAAPRLFPGR